ncbi:MAG: hypothetical protein ACFFAS_21135 [Promethearchaeota archaeon]
MPNCVKCGTEISEEQFKNFNKMCSDCTRLFKYSKKSSGKSMLVVGIPMLIFGFGFFLAAIMESLSKGFVSLTVIYFVVALILIPLGFLIFYYAYKKIKV